MWHLSSWYSPQSFEGRACQALCHRQHNKGVRAPSQRRATPLSERLPLSGVSRPPLCRLAERKTPLYRQPCSLTREVCDFHNQVFNIWISPFPTIVRVSLLIILLKWALDVLHIISGESLRRASCILDQKCNLNIINRKRYEQSVNDMTIAFGRSTPWVSASCFNHNKHKANMYIYICPSSSSIVNLLFLKASYNRKPKIIKLNRNPSKLVMSHWNK